MAIIPAEEVVGCRSCETATTQTASCQWQWVTNCNLIRYEVAVYKVGVYNLFVSCGCGIDAVTQGANWLVNCISKWARLGSRARWSGSGDSQTGCNLLIAPHIAPNCPTLLPRCSTLPGLPTRLSLSPPQCQNQASLLSATTSAFCHHGSSQASQT